jgi:COPI associated protein
MAMILVALLSLLTTTSATTGVLACYIMAFSCLLCCFETHLKQVSKVIAVNFGFLYSGYSRAAFLFFVSTIMFSLSLFGKLIGLFMMANALFNIFVLIKYPGNCMHQLPCLV